MINKITFAAILIFLIANNVFSGDFKKHPDYKLILKEAELGDKILISGKIFQTLEYINVDSLSEKTKFEQDTKDKMLKEGEYNVLENYKRFEMLFYFKNTRIHSIEKAIRNLQRGNKYLHYVENVYDGEVTIKLRMDSLGAGGTIEAIGDIYEGNAINRSSNFLLNGYFINGISVNSFLSGDDFTFYDNKKAIKLID